MRSVKHLIGPGCPSKILLDEKLLAALRLEMQKLIHWMIIHFLYIK
jgi:hypothetical protein